MNLVRYGSWIGGDGFSHNRGNGGWYGYGLVCLIVVVWSGRSYIVPGYRWPFYSMGFYPVELHITWQERLYMLAMEVRRVPA